jgi:hypothetical protein
VLKNQAGAVEYLAKYRGPTHATESRDYVASWDLRNGLTNTSPRRYGGLAISRSGATSVYAPMLLESRRVDATIDAATPQTQRDLNALTFNVGCDVASGSPVNCSQGVVEEFSVYGRPAQDIKTDDSTTVVTPDFTGASYLQAQAIPRFSIPAGADPANTWIFDGGEFSGPIYDRINGVALAPTGTPRYQAWSGLLARGQGRRGIRTSGSDYLQAAATTTNAVGANAAYTIAVVLRNPPTSAVDNIVVSTNNTTGTSGYSIDRDPNNKFLCIFYTDATHYSGWRSSAYNDTAEHLIHCTTSIVAGAYVTHLYIDGVAAETTAVNAGGGAVSPLVNSNVFTIGKSAAGTAYGFIGQVDEVYTRASLIDAPTALAEYKQLVQQGTFLTNAANISHYKMNETTLTNGIGLRDHSGNGNHLTVVAGTPTPQYADMPWPAGTGTYKPSIEYLGSTQYHAAADAAIGNPDHRQPFSLIAWVRSPDLLSNNYYINKDYSNSPSYVMSTAGLTWKIGGVVQTRNFSASPADGPWHLVAGKAVWDGDSWVLCTSLDGGAFSCADYGQNGDPSGNVGMIKIGNTGLNRASMAGAMIVKNYALTDADVAAYFKAGTSPLSSLTYTRTNAIGYEVGNHPVDGIQIRKWGAGQVPFGWDSTVPTSMGNDRTGWGLPLHDAVVNRSIYSEAIDSWVTASEVTVTANSTAAPDGATTAEKIAGTVNNAAHIVKTAAVYTVPQNNYFTFRAYSKAGAAQQYVQPSLSVSGVNCAFTDLDVNAGTGTPRIVGAGLANVSGSTVGVGNGWLRTLLTAQCTAAGGCALLQAFCLSNAAAPASCCPAYVSAATSYAYSWGYQLVDVGASAASDNGVYCPSPSNSATTCNAASAYDAAANLASWDRSKGQVGTLVFSRNATGYGWDLYNASNAGRIYQLSQGSETYIYDATGAGVLQNRWSLANAQISLPTGIITSWDNTSTYYTDPAGTARRSYSRTMQSSYAGPHDTRTTDVGAAWNVVGGTNLYLGSDNAGANSINGLYVSGQIHSTR